MKIDVRADVEKATLYLRGLSEKTTAPAVARALNRTVTSVRAEAAREMRREYGSLPIRVLKAMMRFVRANRNDLVARLVFANKRIRLTKWGAVQTPTGVRVKGPKQLETFAGDVLKDAEVPAILRGAFIAKSTRTGVENVWIRVGKARYPITGLLAPSLARTFVEGRIQGVLTASAQAKFAVNLERELRFALSNAR